MKHPILTLALLATTFTFSQNISDNLKNALKADDVKKFTMLVDKENINTCLSAGNSDYTLLALTIQLNATSCFNFLLSKNADLEKACASKTPLMYAAKYGNLDMAKKLINAGVNTKVATNKGRTALDYAKRYEQSEVQKYLESL